MPTTAVPAPMPSRVRPMLALLVDEPFSGEDWLFEIKWDGFRAVALIREGKVGLVSRNQRDLTGRFPELQSIAAEIDAREAVLDGEIVALDDEGRPNFQILQGKAGLAVKPEEELPIFYYAFDLIYLDGHDLSRLPLIERKRLLGQVVKEGRLRYSDYVENDGEAFYSAVKERGLEGIVAKKKDSVYEPGRRTGAWKKIKATLTQDIVIGGFTESPKFPEGFGSLLAGVYEGDKLRFAGHVGTGYTRRLLTLLRRRLEPLETDRCPFVEFPAELLGAEIHWVRPALVAEVKLTEWTRDGFMRHPSFQGLREDKEPLECAREAPVGAVAGGEEGPGRPAAEPKTVAKPDPGHLVEVDGRTLRLTNLTKELWPDDGYTKAHLIDHYNWAAGFILPHLRGRPMMLVRYPEGIDRPKIRQKDAPAFTPEWVRLLPIVEGGNTHTNRYVICDDRPTLIWLANIGCVDLNPWASRADSLDNPDYLVLDLDPSPPAGFGEAVRAAQLIKEILDELGLRAYVKTSGATGLHVFVPLEPTHSYEDVRRFAESVATVARDRYPALITIESPLARRHGKVYADYMQNVRGKTMAGVYSVRPRSGAPVSTPLRWEELDAGLKPTDFTIETIRKRVEELGDLLAPVLAGDQQLLAGNRRHST